MEENKNTILSLMEANHALLNALFALFRDLAKEKSEKTAAALAELKWETRKHFFIEENAIFDFIPMKNHGVLNTINRLKDEHIIMLNDLKNFEDNLDKITGEQLDNFSNLLEGHRKIEDDELYPKLDKELPPIQRIEIVARVNEIPIRLNGLGKK